MHELKYKLKWAREKSWDEFGKKLTFYVPGMIHCNGISGQYQAVSITGGYCALQCDHCRGRLLQSMIWATAPDMLVEKCLQFAKHGNHGVLISGGCDKRGRLPWEKFLPAIRKIKKETGLYISVHSGLVDYAAARGLKEAGVDQALIDVIGDDVTYQRIYHVPFGISRIISSLEALHQAGLDIVPHIVCGLHFGKIRGENKAIQMISPYNVSQVVIVSVMRLPGLPGPGFNSPGAASIAEIIADTRFAMPQVPVSLGCARQRGNRHVEILAIDAGVNRMALPSDEAVEHAEDYGLEIRYQATCCSVSKDYSKTFKGSDVQEAKVSLH